MNAANGQPRFSFRISVGLTLTLLFGSFLVAAGAFGQATSPASSPSGGNAEVTTEEKPTTFKLRANLVEETGRYNARG
jgi:hypothetical protein